MEVAYWLDQKNRLEAFNTDFTHFGTQNGVSPELSQSWLGRDMLSLIVGDTTRMYYYAIFQKIRVFREPISLAYRCDSPDAARFMRMHLKMEDKKRLYIQNDLEAEVLFNEPTPHFSAVASSRIKRCSICNQVRIRQQWLAPNQIRLYVAHSLEDHLQVQYVLCPSCMEMGQQKIA